MIDKKCQIEEIGVDMKETLFRILREECVTRPFFVARSAFQYLDFMDEIRMRYPGAVFFDDFTSNPVYESVLSGKDCFRQKGCDFIVAIGGGSAIDVAKCIKAYAHIHDNNCLQRIITDNGIKMLAIPTTAGTGSEATHFAVIYDHGVKRSVCHESLLPEYVILSGEPLKFLPIYHKKAALLDVLCHSIESLWSINSTEESKNYATTAVKMFIASYASYLRSEEAVNLKMLCASNYAGKAINITRTTAAHAMSYKITSMFGLSHGHSVALCLPRVWSYMLNNMDQCVDPRGREYLCTVFQYISDLLGCANSFDAITCLDKLIFHEFEMDEPKLEAGQEMAELMCSVDIDRLGNNPIRLDDMALSEIYHSIFSRMGA